MPKSTSLSEIAELRARVQHLEGAISAAMSIMCTVVAPSLGPEFFAKCLGQMATQLDDRAAEDIHHPVMATLMRDMAARIESTHAAYLANRARTAH